MTLSISFSSAGKVMVSGFQIPSTYSLAFTTKSLISSINYFTLLNLGLVGRLIAFRLTNFFKRPTLFSHFHFDDSIFFFLLSNISGKNQKLKRFHRFVLFHLSDQESDLSQKNGNG